RRLPADRAGGGPRREAGAAEPRHLLRPHHRCADGVPLVQRPPRAAVPGRRGLPVDGGDARRGGDHHGAAPAAGGDRRGLLRGDHERRAPGRLIPAPRPADLPDDAAPAPLRADRLGRGEDHDALLDRRRPRGAARLQPLSRDRARAVARPMTTLTAPIATLEDLRGRHALVLGLARSGTAVARLLADAGAEVAAYDRRPPAELSEAVQTLGARPVRLALGVSADEARALVAAADLLVTSPSISPTMPTTD